MQLIQRFLFSVATLVVGLAIAASFAAFAQHLAESGSSGVFALVVGLSALCGLGVLLISAAGKTPLDPDRGFVLCLAGITLALKLVWIAWHSGYPQLADHAIFLDFVNRLASSNFSPATLRELSGSYDYYIWVSRGMPFQHLFAQLAPEGHVVWAQVFNAVIQACTLLALHGVAGRLMLPPSTRRLSVILYATIPFHWWQVLEYNHHIYSTFLMTVLVWIVLRLGQTASRWWVAALHGTGIGAVLFALALQVGVDQLALIFVGLAAVWALIHIKSVGRAGAVGRLGLILVIAVGMWGIGKRSYFDWQASFDERRLSSGVAGFLARGWSMEKLGEYDGRFEQLDRITPAGENLELMLAVPVSRLADQPLASFAQLLPAKVAKFGLIGFATTAEDSLKMFGRPREAEIFRSLRLLHAPLFLALVLVALLHAGCGIGNPSCWLLPVVLVLAGCGVFAMMGETSPRYSIYVQPYLALLASGGLVALRPSQRTCGARDAMHHVAHNLPGVLAVYLAGALVAWLLARQAPESFRFVRLNIGENAKPIHREPFAVGLPAGAVVETPIVPAGRATLYAWRDFSAHGGTLEVFQGTNRLLLSSIAELQPVERLELMIPAPGSLRIQAVGSGVERLGYLRTGLAALSGVASPAIPEN
jgi:hypothetical protein